MSSNTIIKSALFILWLQLFYISEYQTKNIPSYIPSCKRNDPEINECMRNATVLIRPYLKNGIPELKIPSIEPLTIPMLKLQQGTDAVNYKATLTNVQLRGLSTYKFKEIKGDLNNLNFQGTIDIGQISLKSDYVIMGSALLLPIRGNGIFAANFSSAIADVTLDGTLIKRKGKEYYHNIDTDVKIQVGKVRAKFDNLFDGDEMLTKVTNEFLNMHAKEIVEEVKPAVETMIAMIIDDIINKVFQTLPFDRIFPHQ